MNSSFNEIHEQFGTFSFNDAPPAGSAEAAPAPPASSSSAHVEQPALASLAPRKSSGRLGGMAAQAGEKTSAGRTKLIMTKVAHLRNEGTLERLSPAEHAVVDGGFLLAKHVRAISICMDVMKAGCSFCHAGEWTLKKIALGAEAKGHDTLDKTLKPATMRAAFPHDSRYAIEAEHHGLFGHVASLDPARHSAHLVMGREAAALEFSTDEREEALFSEFVWTSGQRVEYPVDLDRMEESLEPLKRVPHWARLPLTGDYDLHDLFSVGGRPHSVPSNSGEESSLISAINAAISAADPELRPVNQSHMKLVKHGPQVNYVGFTLAEERDAPLNRSVAEPRFPVAMYVANSDWTIVNNREELDALYKKHNVAMKQSWTPRGSISFEGPDNNVTMTRRSSTATTGSDMPRRPSRANTVDLAE
ncbi:hypothetical protein [Burkholderia ambifaria]|uniref:Uncharacterized protein n=1 Tax=Burkholderia ambifaria TaxID=152480 RepID=A0AA41E9G3_9BURK|nr:hypothetical protein [Burkholderia ambifaria]MBR8130768.1 hypothetical protein [Burkholderia ambifaria]PRD96954.1 hypothetical protein C6P77_23770 [Burkholderia ambifaria]